MTPKDKNVALTIIFLVAFAAIVTGLFVYQHIHKTKIIDSSELHGTYLEKPRSLERFQLTSTDGKTFSNKNLDGHWTMIFFGFTNCGHVCPMTMSELSKTYKILERKQVMPLPEVIMVSIDPERDSLEKLKTYVKSFDPHFYGLRGDNPAVKNMASEMGIAYEKKMALNSEDYDILHSGAIMLINPQGQLNAFFTSPHRADFIAEDYQLLVGAN